MRRSSSTRARTSTSSWPSRRGSSRTACATPSPRATGATGRRPTRPGPGSARCSTGSPTPPPCRDIRDREIRIYRDAGRICRPLLIVEDCRLLMKKRHIEMLKEREFNNYQWQVMIRMMIIVMMILMMTMNDDGRTWWPAGWSSTSTPWRRRRPYSPAAPRTFTRPRTAGPATARRGFTARSTRP